MTRHFRFANFRLLSINLSPKHRVAHRINPIRDVHMSVPDTRSFLRAWEPVGLRANLLRRRETSPFFRSFSLRRTHSALASCFALPPASLQSYAPQTIEKLSCVSHSPRYDPLSQTGSERYLNFGTKSCCSLTAIRERLKSRCPVQLAGK